ncbi:MAG: class I SAM-dependent methyltransferase [Candidatus Rokuibacteriota bacterium]
MIRQRLERPLLAAAVYANNKAKRLAIRLTKWTGKSAEYVHPKHLLGETADHYWYLRHVGSGERLLDVGCGNGMHTLKAARRCARALGIDRDAASLAVAHRLSRALGAGHVDFATADVETGLPVARGAFDTVLCLDLLEHVHHRALVLAEIRRALSPRGRLLLAVPNRATSWKRRLAAAGLFAYSDPDHKIEYTLDELREELAGGGFAITELVPSVYDTPLVGLIDVVGSLSLPAYRRLTGLRRRMAARRPEQNAGFYAICRAR